MLILVIMKSLRLKWKVSIKWYPRNKEKIQKNTNNYMNKMKMQIIEQAKVIGKSIGNKKVLRTCNPGRMVTHKSLKMILRIIMNKSKNLSINNRNMTK